MLGRLGPIELVLILVIALVVFGPKKLPEIGKAFGQTIKQFRDHANKISEEEAADSTVKTDEGSL